MSLRKSVSNANIGSNAAENIYENNISAMRVGWILHCLVKTMVLVNPVLYSWTFLFRLQEVSQTKSAVCCFFSLCY